MLDWIILGLKIIAVPIVSFFALLCFLHLRILSRIRYYEK